MFKSTIASLAILAAFAVATENAHAKTYTLSDFAAMKQECANKRDPAKCEAKVQERQEKATIRAQKKVVSLQNRIAKSEAALAKKQDKLAKDKAALKAAQENAAALTPQAVKEAHTAKATAKK